METRKFCPRCHQEYLWVEYSQPFNECACGQLLKEYSIGDILSKIDDLKKEIEYLHSKIDNWKNK